jgi:amidase
MPFAGPPEAAPVRVAFTAETYGQDLHPEVAAALQTAREALQDAGYVVETVAPPSALTAGRDGYSALMGEVLALMAPAIRAQGSATVNAIFDEYFRQFRPHEGIDLLQAMARRSHYAREWSLFLQRWPLVLTPFLPRPTYRPLRDTEGEEGVQEVLGAAVWSYAINFVGLPAGVISPRLSRLPGGQQPTAVQIVGRRWREDLILDAMAAIEARCGRMSARLPAFG